ncbi:MAG: aconitate hydratase [Clostridia bacterium]|nr:MAG: aconitate hydratase [Clostridia bacterium]
MGNNLTYKILCGHLVSGHPVAGEEIGIRIDQTLTQDATGTMAYLQFEAIGVPRVRTKLSVSYVDHNTLQTGFENADDHRFLQSMAAKYGVYFSRPGNGICHQVHLERFGVPGQTLLGSDSHTPTAGALGMIAIGAGGLDVAVAMAGGPFYLQAPQVVKVYLTGELPPWVSAKDVILEVLRRLTVKGGVGKVIEYTGPGVAGLSIPQRATITNMGAELGATTSIFPSDRVTQAFLAAQGREEVWQELGPDPDAACDEVLEIDLGKLVPLAARPHSPDNVAPVEEIGPVPVQQVVIGSCTNSSYADLMRVAAILKGRVVHPDVSLVIAPGSRQVLHMLAQNGALADLIAAGARVVESACGPCIGMGQAPPSAGVSVRTFNRNFKGRSSTPDAQVYLTSPEVAAATALKGALTDPRDLGACPQVTMPVKFAVDDRMILPPAAELERVEIVRGPNIKPLPAKEPLPADLKGRVLLKVGDNITTDDILPGGSQVLPLRSNIPAISRYTFTGIDPEFVGRAAAEGGGFIVGGQNYGQGSSREHAALAPMYLGIKAVLALSFARIHKANLINFGILPLIFAAAEDYELVQQGDELSLLGIRQQLENFLASQGRWIAVDNLTRGGQIRVTHDLSSRQVKIILAGGLLNFTREQGK